jgi:hypothetical protein
MKNQPTHCGFATQMVMGMFRKKFHRERRAARIDAAAAKNLAISPKKLAMKKL